MFRNTYLTYNNEEIRDGYFAQLQRQMAIYSIARRYLFSYCHSTITEVTITPLDSFKTKAQMIKRISEYNKIYAIDKNKNEIVFSKIIEMHAPTLLPILWQGLKHLFRREKILIKITIPYRIIEKNPDLYSSACRKLLSNFNSKCDTTSVVIHIRRGVLESHITAGEISPRPIGIEYFISVLKQITKMNSFSELDTLTILTDAPAKNIYFKPSLEQENLHIEFNYLKSDKGILVKGYEFNEFALCFPGKVNIIRGGDAHEAVSKMRFADHFIMSRSSMSYVGALLNTSGAIYYPPNFWHKPQKKWIKGAKFI